MTIIAALFGVSTDEILGADKALREEKIQQYIDEYYDLWKNGEPEKCLR